MEDKKWIFIENSSETVRYKVGDSDSSMDSQDYEYLPAKNSPPPSVFEFIPPKKEEIHSGDELEIHDNHFLCSSCPTSDMEDSDIEVVMKSPSSSETASLCSLNSQKSLHNETCKYEEMIFNVEISEKLNYENEEEDSEVEVISRSIHRNESIDMSYVEEIDEDISLNTTLSTSGSENENEEEIEECAPTKYSISFATSEYEADEEQCHPHPHRTDKTNEENYVESIEDYGIKYLFEDLHVSRQINSRLVGLKTSTLVLTAFLSVTLGIYLGYYWSPMSNGRHLENEAVSGDDTVVIPEDMVHSNNDEPLSVNITFRYSSSTKESLRSVLNTFRKLKQDYDRLHADFDEMKEKYYLQKQMTFYWRRQVKTNSIEHYEKEHVTEDDISTVSQQPNAMLNLSGEKINSMYNDTYQTHRKAIRKLSRDLKRERNTAMYWRQRYNDVEFSKENTCSKYGPKSQSFSFSDCFNIFSKVIPKLNISVLNITNPAENLADQVQNAWSLLRNRWKAKEVRKDDPIHLRKVDRFRKIFIISNVVTLGSIRFRGHIVHAKTYENHSVDDSVQSDINPQLDFNITSTRKSKEGFGNVNMAADDETPDHEIDFTNSIPMDTCEETSHDKHNTSSDYYNRDGAIQHESSESIDGLHWFKTKFQESKFLFNIFKWQTNFKNEIDILKSRNIARLMNENERQSKKLQELSKLESENIILKEKIIEDGEYFENIRKKLKTLRISERKKCNSSIGKVKTTIKRRYNYLIKNIQKNVRNSEKSKYNKRVHNLMGNERKRYHLSLKEVRKTIRKEEKTKFKRKLRKMKKSFKRGKKREHKKFKLEYKNKKLHQEQEKHHHMNRKIQRTKNRSIVRDKKLKKNISVYANKYQQSVEEVTHLRDIYSEAVEKAKHQEQVVEVYKDELERYKTIIQEYERKINEVVEREKHQEKEIHNLAEKMKNYNKVIKENARLKRSVTTLTTPTSNNKQLSYVDVNKNENIEEVVEPMNNSEVEKDYVTGLSSSKCYKDTDLKPFYNINDVYPEDLFSRTMDINPPSPSMPLNLFPNPQTLSPFPDQDVLRGPNSHFQEKLFDLSPFSDKFLISGTNESQSDIEDVPASLYEDWDKGKMEFNEYTRNEHIAMPNNWYINWMQEKDKNRKVNPFESDVSEKEGFWFWKRMKEREKLRSYEGGEVNWFWKAMKERENLRSYEWEENWFIKAMKNREKLRNEEEEVN